MKAILMQTRKKCQLNVWLLSGTGDGPCLAKVFLERGWKVSVSVVSYQASLAYSGLNLDEVFIGPLNGVGGVFAVLNNAKKNNRRFDYVIDATHPFAEVISSNLKIACEKLNQSFIRYERPLEETHQAKLIKELKELQNLDLRGQKLLLAIGSRFLPEAFSYAQAAGAEAFARVLPTVEGLLQSLVVDIPQENLAVLKPLQGKPIGSIEAALCRKWNISAVICRESGGLNQKIWSSISKSEKVDLWLISRPPSPLGIEKAYTINELIEKMALSYS